MDELVDSERGVSGGQFETVYRCIVYYCAECDDFELEKTYRGVAGTPGEDEFDEIDGPDTCPACEGRVERDVVA